MMRNQYLYHYTSVETLEKILTSKSILFSRLDFVDDLDEAQTLDIKDFGKFFYVSCWTKEEKESIPMWNIYSHEMMGVRIKLKEFPFKKYIIQPGKIHNKERIESYIDMVKRYKNDMPYILPKAPQLIEIDYTEREELLYPPIKTMPSESKVITITRENGNVSKKTESSKSVTYDLKNVGEFKRKCWAFQQEWRYKIFVAPYTIKELELCKTHEDQTRLLQRMEDEKYFPEEGQLYLKLSDIAIKNMEILVGPRADENILKYVYRLAESHGIEKNNIKKSELRIR